MISLTYIYTTNRQQNTQTQYPPHGEKPGINMTQATTTAVFFNDVVTYWTMIRTHVVPDRQ